MKNSLYILFVMLISLASGGVVFADMTSGIRQLSTVKKYNSRPLGNNLYRVDIVIPYEPGYDWDLDFQVNCNSRKLTRGDGVTPATARVEVSYHKYLLSRTCQKTR